MNKCYINVNYCICLSIAVLLATAERVITDCVALQDEVNKYFFCFYLVVFLFGALTIALSFAASYFTSKIVQTAATVWGILGCPLGGIFVMGFFMPFCNSAVSAVRRRYPTMLVKKPRKCAS